MLITQHPTESLLREYALGQLSDGMALAVATHVELCPRCAEIVREVEAKHAEHLMTVEPEPLSSEAMSLLQGIIASDPTEAALKPKPSVVQRIVETEVNGKRFKLPKTLQKVESRVERWDHLVGNLWRANMPIHGDFKANLIYMEQGGGIAEHTHRGKEVTLVLDGIFEDEFGQYVAGDFVYRDGTCKHKPQTESHCLCLAVMDAPLHFSSGFARLLNPFSRLFF